MTNSTRIKKYQYSEIFGNTIQGEGKYTGVPTVWMRVWGCNFECNGFSQEFPDKPETWNLDYQTIDISSIKTMEDLPVFNTGCDSSYSWSKKFAHLAHKGTASEICDKLESFLKSDSNPEGKFLHPKSKQYTHMAFTGGEPMMSQSAIIDVMLEFAKRGNVPKYVTVESNGTQTARMPFVQYLTGTTEGPKTIDEMIENSKNSFHMRDFVNICSENFSAIPTEYAELQGIEWFWSVSPKLYLSGEKWDNAIKPEVVSQYNQLSNNGQLKYVCDGTDRAWNEIEQATELYRKAGVSWPVYIMPVSGTKAGQEKIQRMVAEGAVERGYNVAARVHCWIWGNTIGK